MTVVFEPPAKGQWISLRDHFPRALTPEYERILCSAMPDGEAVPFEAYGMPVATLEARTVHGHVYVAPRPLMGGHRYALPPRAALWAAARLVPAFRRRTKAARRALAERPWLAEARAWYERERDEWTTANTALQAEELDGLDGPALLDHLQRARRNAAAGYRRHFALHGPDLLPSGLLLVWCADHGIAVEDVLPVLTGCSPASLGRGPALDAVRAAVAAGGRASETLEEVRAVAGPALDALLTEQGWRLVTGYDLDSLALGELPALVTTLATAPEQAGGEPQEAPALLEGLRARVPVEARPELDQLVADARATFGVRDDNGSLTAVWPMGLLRRAMLAAGRTLAEQGRLHEPSHALELTVDELGPLLVSGTGPSPQDVQARADDRAERSRLLPPLQLGPDVDVPLDALPLPMRTIARAQLALRDTFTAPLDGRQELTGDGVGRAVVRARACVATDAADALTRLRPGDVLVATGTTPAFNLALSIAGAVVVEEGGLLSHAAVIARELGLTAVIGATGATAAVPDGALVEVDPGSGQVRVLAPAP